jgi:hypothetical protein
MQLIPDGQEIGKSHIADSPKAILEEVYQWLQAGPIDDWNKRCHYHRKIGDMLGKKPVECGAPTMRSNGELSGGRPAVDAARDSGPTRAQGRPLQ